VSYPVFFKTRLGASRLSTAALGEARLLSTGMEI